MHAASASHERPLFNPLLALLPLLSLGVILALNASMRWRLAFLAVCTAATFRGFQSTTTDKLWDFTAGSMLSSNWLTVFALLFLVNPIEDYRHRTDGKVSPKEYSFYYRVYWCLCTVFSVRGIGWNYRIAYTSPEPKQTRWTFVGTRLIRIIACFLLMDATQIYILRHPEFFSSRADPPLAEQEFMTRSIITFMAVFIMAVGMYVHHSYVSAVWVAVGWSQPDEWPNIFGSIWDAYSVGNFWGIVWHQTFTRMFILYAKHACRILHLPRDSVISRAVFLLVVFTVSGLIHCAGDLTIATDNFGASFPFFILQAFAILFEEAVKSGARKIGIPSHWLVWRMLGYIWTGWWFANTAVGYIHAMIRAGSLDAQPFPVSFWRTVGRIVEAGGWAQDPFRLD